MIYLHNVMETQCQYLTMTKCNELLKLLHIFKELFDRTLGTWKTDQVNFELKEDANIICTQPYTVPNIHEEMFKKEVERLSLLRVLKIVNYS